MAKSAKVSKTASEKSARGLMVPLVLKVATATVVLVGLLLAAAAAISLWQGYKEAERSALAIQQEKADALAGRIDGLMSSLESQLDWTTEPDWRAAGVERQHADFTRLMRQFPGITELYYIDSRGFEQLKVSRLAPDSVASMTAHADEPRFVETVKARSWIGPVYVRNGTELAGTIGLAHADGGATIAELDLAFLAEPVKAAAGDGGQAFVVDAAGRLIAHPDRNPATGETDLSALPQVAAALAAGGSGTSTSATMNGDAAPAFAAWAQVPQPGWTAIVQTPRAAALAPFQTLLWQTALLGGAGLLAAAIVGASIARRIVLPIRKLQASTDLLGEGDLTQRVDVRRRDEIGGLADKFNAMANRLQQSQKGLEARIDDSAVGFDVALQQQSMTAEMVKTIARTDYDLERVLDDLIGSTVRLTEANVGAVWLRDGDAFRLAAQLGHTGDWVEAARKAPFTKDTDAHAVAAAAAYSGQVINVDDVLRDLRFMGEYGERPANADERAALAIPIKHGDRVEAVFSLSRADPLPFIDRQVALAQDFADQASIAIRKVRLNETIETRNRELAEALEQQAATRGITRIIGQAPSDIQPVLDTIAANAARLCKARYCHVAVLDDGLLHFRAHHGLPSEVAELLGSAAAPATGGPADQTITGREAVLVPDLQAKTDAEVDELARRLGVRSLAAIPLVRNDAAIGVLTVADPEPNAIPEQRLALLRTLADQAVITLDNARLAEEGRARTAERDASRQELAERTGERDEWRLKHTEDVEAAERRRSAEMDEAQRLHAAAVEEARQEHEAAEQRHAAEMDEAKRLHAAAMEEARQQYEAAEQDHAAALEDAGRLHDAAMEEARRQYEAAELKHAAALEDAGRLHAAAIEEARQRYEAAGQEHAAEMAEARRLHDAAAEDARQKHDGAEKQHAAEMEEARGLHDAAAEEARQAYEAAEQRHATEMDEARRLHDAAAEEARQAYEAAEQKHAGEMDEARRLHDATAGEARQAYDDAEQKHAAAMAQARRLHDADVTQARQDREAAEQRHSAEMDEARRLHDAETDRMREQHEAETAEARRLHAYAMDGVHTAHATELDEVRNLHATELGDARKLHAEDRDQAERLRGATAHALALLGDVEGDPQRLFEAVVATALDACRANSTDLRLVDDGAPRVVASGGASGGYGAAADLAVAEARIVHIGETADAMPGAALAVPVMVEGKAAGALTLWRQKANAFTEREIEVATMLAAEAAIAIAAARQVSRLEERGRSLGEARRELGEAHQGQQATAEVLRSVNDAFDLADVLTTVAGHAARLCGAATARVYLNDGDCLHVAAGAGVTPEQRADDAVDPHLVDSGSPVARAALDKAVVHLPDLAAGASDASRFGDAAAMLCVPILHEDVAIGVLALTRAEAGAFSERQIELARTLSDQAAVAVEKSRLLDEVTARKADYREALLQQAAIADVLTAIGRPEVDLRGVLTALTASAASFCGAGGAAIYLPKDGEYRVGAATGAMPADLVRPQSPGRESWIGRAALDRTLLHVPDADAEAEQLGIAGVGGLAAILCVPLPGERAIGGVLALTRSEAGPFTEREVALARIFADQAAIAIESVRRSDEMQAHGEERAGLLKDLHAAQARLSRTDRLAALGQQSAGLGREIEERLAELNEVSLKSNRLVDGIRMVLEGAVIDGGTRAEVEELGDTLKENLDRVVWAGRRADSLVRNTLLQSLDSAGEHRPVDINAVLDESLGLAYHGARAERQGFRVTLEKALDPKAGAVDLYPQEITRALFNVISNGFDATARRSAANGGGYEAVLAASTRNLGDAVEITIRDNGTGIPGDVRERMFEPFFTTKPAGEGTGLGLSLSRDIIVRQHAGTIEVDTEPGSFTEFRIVLPRGAATLARREGEAGTAQSS